MKAEKFNHPLLNMMNSPSSAADVWTRRQPKTETDTEDKEPVDNKTVDIPPVHTYDELKKIRRDAYVKMVAIIGVVVTALVFGSVAWFTQNREVEGAGVQMTAENRGFELKIADGNIGYSELYAFLSSFTTNNSLITNNTENGDTIQWRISGSSDSIKPGSQGVLEFTIVTSGADASSLHYNLDIICYEKTTNGSGDNITVTGLSEITSTSSHTADQKAGAGYLNAHLMFFKERTGANESVWQYSGFINNINDFTLTPVATETANEYTAKIYWIWPNTIGQIMLDSSNVTDQTYLGSRVTSVLNSMGETSDRAIITTYLTTNTSTMFNGTESYDTLITALYTNRAESTSFQTQYDKLSSGYNAADLTIGKNVDYIAVLLQASVDN